MANQSNGGRWALGGYLYQLIGQLSLTVTPIGECLFQDGQTEARFLVDSRGVELESQAEAFGQDAAYIAGEQVALVQFKYSSINSTIYDGEIEGIIDGLVDAARRMDNFQVATCALVTNRDLSSSAQERWDAAQREHAGQLELVLTRMELEAAKHTLDTFGKKYGALWDERVAGLDQLLGRTFRQLGEGAIGEALTASDFIEAFTGMRNARPLNLSAIAQQAGQDLRRFGNDNFYADQWRGTGVQRELYQDLHRATQEHALVIVSGPGGCGKSMLIWQLLTELTAREQGACTAKLARTPDSILVPVKVNEWRGIPVGRGVSDTPEKAIERILVANEDKGKPILYLGLDGIDEQEYREAVRHETAELIEWFYLKERSLGDGPPSATLLVSCRQYDEVSRDWLGLAPGREASDLGHIRLDEFSKAEFEEAIKMGVPSVYEEMLEAGALRVVWPQAQDFKQADYSGEPIRPQARGDGLDRAVMDMLRHPTMWQALLRLEEEAREQAFRGEELAVARLVENFLEWFRHKLHLRDRGLRDLDSESLRRVLRSIATESRASTNHSRDLGWIRPACATDLVNESEARDLYREARSVGAIVESERMQWRWRNEILAEMLAFGGRRDG